VPGGQPGAPQGLNVQAVAQTLADRIATDKTFSQIGFKKTNTQNKHQYKDKYQFINHK